MTRQPGVKHFDSKISNFDSKFKLFEQNLACHKTLDQFLPSQHLNWYIIEFAVSSPWTSWYFWVSLTPDVGTVETAV
jgi:hypothetical protein